MPNKRVVIIRNAAAHDFGGGERFPVFLSEALKSEGFSPVIISRSKKLLSFAKQQKQKTIKGWWWSKQQWSGGNNILIPFYLLWQAFLYIYYSLLFSSLKPSVVHIQSKDDFIAATHAAYGLGIRVIWTDHADLKHIWKNVTMPYKNPIGKLVFRAAKKADAITVVSKSEEKLVTGNLLQKTSVRKKIHVVYNGVFDVKDNYTTSPSSATEFLVASRLVTDKGINEVIDAFAALHDDHADTRLTIIGDGPEADTFKEKASSCKAINFKGHQKDPLSFMASASVFVHPTYHEGFSVALVEAGMMQLPIIATSVGGNVEIIKSGKTGLLVPAKDALALKDAMEQLYSNENLRKTLAKNARKQYLESFQFNTIVKESFIPLYSRGRT